MAHFEFIFAAVTVVLALAWFLARFAFTSRTARDLVWRTALVVVAMTPLLSFVRGACSPWQWALPILPSQAASVADTDRVSTSSQPSVVRTSPAHVDAIEPIPAAPFAPLPVPPHIAEIVAADDSQPSTPDVPATSIPEVTHEAPIKTSPPPRIVTWPVALASIWLLGTLLQVTRILLAAWRAHRLTVASVPTTDRALIDLSAWAARRVGLNRPAALLTNAHVGVPVVSGIRRPAIIVPPVLTADDARPQFRATLLHEYGHVRRHDVAFDLLLKLVVAALWPHPLVHLMSRELRHLREEICDNFVLAEESPVTYSEMLLRLSVGLRLSDDGLIGLGMFSNKNRLEARIDALLAPGRSIETRPRPVARRLLIAGTCVTICAALAVRFEQAAAAPPIALADPAENPAVSTKKTAARDSSIPEASLDGATTKKKAGDKSAPPREFRFRVVTASGKPVEGAKVTPQGLTYRSAGIGFQEQHVASATTDANGDVTVVFTPQMDGIMTAMMQHTGVAGIQWISLKVEHPEFPVRSESFHVGTGAPIVLADPITVRIRASQAGEAVPAARLYPILSPSVATDWEAADGWLTIRRVDVTSASASRWLRIAHVSEDGKAWLSDVIDLKPIAGNPIDVDLELHPTIRVTGKLGEMVPRPVKSGRVNAIAIDATNEAGDGVRNSSWSALADVAADGTFVLDGFPASARHLQLVATCEGWLSDSPTKAETGVYAMKYGFPTGEGIDPIAGMVIAQLYPLKAGASEGPTVAMVPSAACEVTVLDPHGKPLPSATVQFFPNQMFSGFGSNLLGDGVDQLTTIRDRLATGERNGLPKRAATVAEYSTTTNADGVALITGLPAAGDEPQAIRLVSYFVQQPGYIAESNYQPPGSNDFAGPILVSTLTRGKTERVTVRMRPDPKLPLAAAPGQPAERAALDPAVGKTVLRGRVLNEKGEPLEGVQVLTFNEDCFNIRTAKDGRFRYKFDEEMFAENPENPRADEPILPERIDIRFVTPGYAPMSIAMQVGIAEQTITLQNNTYFEGLVRLPDGKPARNVLVRGHQELTTMSDTYPGVEEIWTETRTDDRGHYRLLVQPGAFLIAAGNPGEAIAWLPRRADSTDVAKDRDELSLQDQPERTRLFIFGSEVKKLDINLEQGVDFQARFVDSRTGRPLPKVSLWQREYPDQHEYSTVRGESDDDGLVTIRSMPAGEITFAMTADGYLRAWTDAAAPGWKEAHRRRRPDGTPARMVLMQDGIRFDLQPGMPAVTIALEPPVTMKGRVLDPQGQPVTGAIVRLVRSPANAPPTSTEAWQDKTETKEDGRFSLRLPPSDGHPYSLMVHDGSRHRARDRGEQGEHNHFDEFEWRTWANGVGPMIETTAGQEIDNVELHLSRPGTIRGRLVDKTGKPVARAPVHSIDVDGREGVYHHPIGRSDSEGNFEIRFVRPGRHRVYRGRPNGTPATAINDPAVPIVEVRSGETTDAGNVSAVAEKAR